MDSILFVSPNTYVLRNWIASGLADLAREELGLDAVFLSHFRDASFSSAAGQTYVNHHVSLYPLRGKQLPAGYPEWFYALYYLRLRSVAQELPYGGGQLLDFSRKRDPMNFVLRGARVALPRNTRRRTFVRWLSERVDPGARAYCQLLESLRPICVVIGTPGMLFLDQLVTVAARRSGIPVHCIVNSWDNLVSRGPMMRRPDSLMVWNRYMRDHAVNVHAFDPAAIHIVGSLQFSRYAQPVSREERAAFYRRVDLPEDERFLVYLTSAAVAEYDAEDITELLRRLKGTEFESLPLVVRVHPQADARPFLGLASPRVRLDRPPRFAVDGDNGFSFGEAEMRSMAALLASADLVFASTGTTALLEAIVLDRPAVQLRWMGALVRSRPEQASRVSDYQRFVHYQDLDAAGGHLSSDSPETLLAELRGMLRSSNEFALRRRSAAENLVTMPVGNAPRRVVEVLRHLLDRDLARRTTEVLSDPQRWAS